MDALAGKHIVVGITGGIAGFKAPMLVRLLREYGADVQVVMGANAARFVTATTLQAVSGRPVRSDLWDEAAEASMGHIELARWADVIVVAPATANVIARLSHGMADDLLTTLTLATHAPVVLAPAMNQAMWRHEATRRNAALVQELGYQLLGPDEGDQACGDTGPGRMTEPLEICQALNQILIHAPAPEPDAAPGGILSPALAGKRVLITTGPTREAIDPVRYISNHSSGKQGFALAVAARDAGAEVTVIAGPHQQVVPAGIRCIDVISARNMLDAALANLPGQDIFIGVAAVADFRPANVPELKIKRHADDNKADDNKEVAAKQGSGLESLQLIENPDIIATVAKQPNRPYVVGFAAETHNAMDYAREKRKRKGLDAIVVNDVSDTRIGFNSDDNAATLIWGDGEESFERQPKHALAASLIQRLAIILQDKKRDKVRNKRTPDAKRGSRV